MWTRATSLVLLAALAFPATAWADDRAFAEELFQLGKSSMATKDYAKACGYFQGSLKADFALGTLLNLAICHEQDGKLASAWGDYKLLADRARRATPPQNDRAQFATEHAEALRPRLSRVRIRLAPETKALAGLTVKIDGVAVQPELFETGVPVDGGKRVFSASAPGYTDWTKEITVEQEKQNLETTIPPLVVLPKAAEPAPAATTPAPAPPTVVELDSKRILGFVVGGVGVAALATGIVFGVLAGNTAGDAECRGCLNGSDELTQAKRSYDRANTFGWISNIGIVAGAVGLGTGLVLVLTSGPKKSASVLTLAPRAGVDGGGFVLGGTL